MSNAMNSFKATGIRPVDRHVFKDTDFIVAETLMSSENCHKSQEEGEKNKNCDERQEEREEIENYDENQEEREEIESYDESREGCEEIDIAFAKRPYFTEKCQSRKLLKTVHEISLVSCPTSVRRNSKGPQEAELLTSSPHKKKLEEQEKKKLERITKKCDKLSKSSISGNLSKLKTKKQSKPTSSKQLQSSTAVIEINDNDWYCHLCQNVSVEDMIQCTSCKRWAHESCADTSKEDVEFSCCFCL